jgi:DNA-binding transcriptional LysR family regulator
MHKSHNLMSPTNRQIPDRKPSFRELEVLHALIEWRKTTSAATRLGLSQPAVSRALQQLESRMGKALFRREGGRLHATAEGVRLYEDTRPIFAALDRLGRSAADTDDADTIKIIAPPTLGHLFLPGLLAGFLASEPGLKLQMESGTTTDVLARVADGNVDVGIADSHSVHPSLVFQPFRRAYAHVVMPADHPLAERTEIAPIDMTGERFIALTRRFPVRGAIERVFIDAGATLNVVAEAATSALAYEMVKAGAGLTLINPFPLTLHANPNIVMRPFLPRIGFESVFVLSTAAQPTATVRRFMAFLREHQVADAFSECLRGPA